MTREAIFEASVGYFLSPIARLFDDASVTEIMVDRFDQYGRGELTIRQRFVASLRMRPDRSIVGEVRGGEALDMLQAMLSGHVWPAPMQRPANPRNTRPGETT